MEGIREVALAHYGILPVEEKAKIERDFKWSTERGSVSEYFRSLDDKLRPEAVDAWLEACEGYKEGSFNLNDFITLKYMVTGMDTLLECDGCSTLILGRPFFSCSECLSTGEDSYDLCCDCYISKKFEDHNHQEFYDSYKLQRLGRRKFAETKRVSPATQAYFEWFFLNLAHDFVEIAENLKTHGLNEEEFGQFDPKEALAEISRHVKELERISGATEKEESENATGFMPKPHRSWDDLSEAKPGKKNEDEDSKNINLITSYDPSKVEPSKKNEEEEEENSTRFGIGDLLGAKASEFF